MKIAVIETGGKQYVVANDTVLTVEKIKDAKEGETITFSSVLLTDDGVKEMVGTPYVKGASVKARVLEVGRSKKIVVQKFRPKSNYHKKQGHRQHFTKVRISL